MIELHKQQIISYIFKNEDLFSRNLPYMTHVYALRDCVIHGARVVQCWWVPRHGLSHLVARQRQYSWQKDFTSFSNLLFSELICIGAFLGKMKNAFIVVT